MIRRLVLVLVLVLVLLLGLVVVLVIALGVWHVPDAGAAADPRPSRTTNA